MAITVREARLVAGLTQRKMADMLGIPLRTIENWEGGQSAPPEYVRRLVVNELLRMAKKADA